jgi:hypothetical protein
MNSSVIQAPNEATPAIGWVMSVKDLTPDRTPARYEVTKADGSKSLVTLEKRKRQIVDTLLMRPRYCASTVRLGDGVFRLKSDHGLRAETKTAVDGRKYYSLSRGHVRRVMGGVE